MAFANPDPSILEVLGLLTLIGLIGAVVCALIWLVFEAVESVRCGTWMPDWLESWLYNDPAVTVEVISSAPVQGPEEHASRNDQSLVFREGVDAAHSSPCGQIYELRPGDYQNPAADRNLEGQAGQAGVDLCDGSARPGVRRLAKATPPGETIGSHADFREPNSNVAAVYHVDPELPLRLLLDRIFEPGTHANGHAVAVLVPHPHQTHAQTRSVAVEPGPGRKDAEHGTHGGQHGRDNLHPLRHAPSACAESPRAS